MSELDADRDEVRKIEMWRDGRVGCASLHVEAGGTRPGKVPVPPLAVIDLDPEFQPEVISTTDFKDCWEESVRL